MDSKVNKDNFYLEVYISDDEKLCIRSVHKERRFLVIDIPLIEVNIHGREEVECKIGKSILGMLEVIHGSVFGKEDNS
jgi:hypothetical protein